MYTPPHFAEVETSALLGIVRARPFATLVASTSSGLAANHLPLLLDEPRAPPMRLHGHVAKANPLWRELPDGAEVLAIFHGPQHYVSPSWYPSKREHGRVVPTWNYVVVHARGTIAWRRDPAWLRALLERTTDSQEALRPRPWRVTDAPSSFIDGNLEAVVGLEIDVRALEGKWKLSQNKSAADRAGVISGLLEEPARDAAELAKMMSDRGGGG